MAHPIIKFPLEYVPAISPGQEFGADRSAFGGTTHKGTDLQGPHKSRVYAGLDGTLVISQSFCGGNTARLDAGNVLDDGNFWSLRYVHMHSFTAAHGAKVKKGQPIGYTDNTGQCTTGDHLHYEVLLNGTPMNPRNVHPELGGAPGVEPIFLMPTWETIVAFWGQGQTAGEFLFDFAVKYDHLEHIASGIVYSPSTEVSLATLMNDHLRAHYGHLDGTGGDVTMANYLDFWHPGKNKEHAVWDFALNHFTHICMYLESHLPYYNAQAKVVQDHLHDHFGLPRSPIWEKAKG